MRRWDSGVRPALRPQLPLSLALRVPEKLSLEDVTAAGGAALLHLEIRNRHDVAWDDWIPNGPLLEIVVLDLNGAEKARQTRQLTMLSPPTRLDPGRGFLLPLRVNLPPLSPRGEILILRFRFAPGTEEAEGLLRLQPRS
jgi:hypothetical protein